MGCLLLGMVLSGGVALGQSTTAPSWELRDGGRWQRVDQPKPVPEQDETLDHIEQMIQAKQGLPAKKIAVAWLKLNKNHPLRDRGIYLLGQANFLYGDRIMAFYNFDEVLDKYPGSRYYYPSLERQYEIADAYLKGYKRRFLMMPMFTAKSEATEMLYRIQQRAPGSPIAEKALLRAADYYYAESDFDIAGDAYAAYVRSYPRSPVIAKVKLRQAFSALAQFRGIRFDATFIIDARQQLIDLAAQFPKVAEEENIPAIVARVDTALAKKLLDRGDYYVRTHKPASAAYYYRHLIKTYPTSAEAALAEANMKKLPAKAIEMPALPKVDVAATQPAAPQEATGTPAGHQPATPTNRESR
ncbi:MAG: outer membrane protein assembly factor BamD [Bacillota bacterium]